MRFPAMVNGPVRKKIMKGRAGVRWDSVVEKVWKDMGGDRGETTPIGACGGYKKKHHRNGGGNKRSDG